MILSIRKSQLIITLIILMKLFIPLRSNKCVNFKYLLLNLQWPTTFAEQSRKGKPELLREHRDRFDYIFTVHGLWPQNSKGGPGPNYCNHTDEFDIETINSIQNIDKYWAGFGMPTSIFWKHEWEKHGTCVANLNQMSTLREYFEFTVEKAEEFDENVFQKLWKDGFKPSNTKYYNAQDYKLAIEEYHGYDIELKCWGIYLSEVRLCYDNNLRPMDCKVTKQKNCKNGILLPA